MKCLIVCDSLRNTKAVKKYVGNMKEVKNVHVAISIDVAIQKLSKFSFNFIVLDIISDKDHNIRLLDWIRASNINVEVVLISSNCNASFVRKAFKYGVCDYVVKPFSLDRLITAINRAACRNTYLNGFNIMNQTEIDNYITLDSCDDESDPSERKGISKQTMNVVEAHIAAEKTSFTATDIAKASGLSRITVRRYLESMVDKGILITDFIYGEIGRPQKAYKKTSEI